MMIWIVVHPSNLIDNSFRLLELRKLSELTTKVRVGGLLAAYGRENYPTKMRHPRRLLDRRFPLLPDSHGMPTI